ncbi:MAG: hypothetical protein V8R85_06095 [Frisingicoccus sp.]
MRGIRTVDRIVELCERDLAFDLPKGINQSGMLSMNL